MATVKMKKMTVYGLKSEKQSVMYLLQRMGVMEITEMEGLAPEDRCKKEVKPEVVFAQKKSNEIESAINSIKSSLGKKAKLPKPECGLKDINNAAKETEKLDSLLSDIKELATKVEFSKNEIARLEALISDLQVYKDMTIAIETIGETEFTTSFIGKISVDNLSKLNEITSNLECNVEIIFQDKKEAYFLLLAHNNVIGDVRQEMRKLSYSKVDLSMFNGLTGLPKDIIEQSTSQLEKQKADLQENTSKLAAFEKDFAFLMMNYEYYNIQIQQEENTNFGAETENAFVIEGWVCEKNVDAIQKSIANLTPNAYASVREPYESEKAPTVLNNPKLIKPFEVVTDLYSAPKAGGFDPNTVMAPFFFIFFGMMFGDAAYGVILAICAFVFMKMKKPKGKMISKLVQLAVIGGVAAAIWGVLSGSYFAQSIPGIPRVFDPMNDPIPVLAVSYTIGVVHLFLGYIIGAYLSMKEGDWVGAIFDKLAWVVLFTGLLLWLGSALVPAIPSALGMWVTIAAAGALVATQGRAKKNIVGKVIGGVLSLYDTTGFLSDVLSYSRLFALGLSGSVIGLVVNMIANMMFGKWFLMPIGVIILIGGHIFNIALNVLGAFVHASRLQYIEFYGKFYDGGGIPFKPLELKTKYVKLS